MYYSVARVRDSRIIHGTVHCTQRSTLRTFAIGDQSQILYEYNGHF